MTPLRPTLTVRRDPLRSAVRTLPHTHLALLVHLTTRACPATGRVWTSPARLAEELGLTSTLIEHALGQLETRRFVQVYGGPSELCTIEMGAVLVREAPAPLNLPLADPV